MARPIVLSLALLLAACSSSGSPHDGAAGAGGTGGASDAGGTAPDAAADAPSGDGAATDGMGADSAGDDVATSDTAAGDAAVGPDGAVRLVQTAACLMCTQKAIDDGSDSCPPQIGCGSLTGADQAACQALLDCMLASKCWQDAGGPTRCFCGTASGLACTTAPAGVCKAEVFAATRTTDPTTASMRFYNFRDYPAAGLVTKLFTCQTANDCKAQCSDLVPAGGGGTSDAGTDGP